MATPIHRFFTKEVTIKRLATVSGYKKSFQTTGTFDAHIQEMNKETKERLGIIEERAWYLWCDIDEDIHEGDTVTDENSIEYIVKEITKKDYGTNEHLQAILEEPNE
jgi:hypothetical protein